MLISRNTSKLAFRAINKSITKNFHSSSSLLARDFYDVLGVDKNVSKSDLKKAYYFLAKKYHPDTNSEPEAAKTFQEVSNAYEILSDDQKRAAYDQFGHAGIGNDGGGGGGNPFGQGGGFSSPEDLFRNIFGRDGGFGRGFGGFDSRGGFGQQQQQRQGPTRGNDLESQIRISFMDAVKGTTKDVDISTLVSCNKCNGSGSKDGKIQKCKRCGGSGVETQQQAIFMMQTTCRGCGGSGENISNPCLSCNSQGVVRERRSVSLNIPAGVDNGLRLRLSGRGDSGLRGGPPGDLYVSPVIDKDPFFERKGNDVHVKVPITVSQAVLGDTIELPTLFGEVEFSIPAGVQPNSKLKMKGKGIKKVNSNDVGDQIVELDVKIPKKLSAKQKELFEEIRKEEHLTSSHNHSGDSNFISDTISRMKRFWT